MAWLVTDKVMPPLLVGDPPDHASNLAVSKDALPICWHVFWNDRRLGWAASRVSPGESGVKEIHSRVVLTQLPLKEMTPVWLRAFVSQIGNIDMDAHSLLEFDPLNRLSSFHTNVSIDDTTDAIQMSGRIVNSRLRLTVRSGELSYTVEKYLPSESLLGSDLSPHTYLPNLRVGQSWTVPVYSPFHPPTSPLDVLRATVEEEGILTWNGASEVTLIVVFHDDGGASYFSPHESRGKLWVRHDGTVLKQEVNVFNSVLSFERMSEEDSRRLVEKTDLELSIASRMEAAK